MNIDHSIFTPKYKESKKRISAIGDDMRNAAMALIHQIDDDGTALSDLATELKFRAMRIAIDYKNMKKEHAKKKHKYMVAYSQKYNELIFSIGGMESKSKITKMAKDYASRLIYCQSENSEGANGIMQ